MADELRRAHLLDGVDWSQMAVLVRSPAASLPPLRRAFAIAGVPLAVSDRDVELQRRSGGPGVVDGASVRSAAATADRPGGDGPAQLPGDRHGRAGPAPAAPAVAGRESAGRFHPGSVGGRVGRRTASGGPAGRPRADRCCESGRSSKLPEREPAIRRPKPVCGRSGNAASWKTGLMAASSRGGRAGQRADSTLDAVLALFSMASDLADRMPLAGVGAFVDLVQGQHIPRDPTAGAARSTEPCPVLSAHAAKGLEWDVVCLAGVSEGRWPVLRSKQSMLGIDEVMDAAAGLPLQTAGSDRNRSPGAPAVLRGRDPGPSTADRHVGAGPGHRAVAIPARADRVR